ncbi:MAG: DUF6541 family protein, partial [Caldilineaceae bacterium]
MLGGSLNTSLQILAYGAIAVYCFFLPGYAISLTLLPRTLLSWVGQIVMAAALSMSLYAVLVLWAYVFGLERWPVIVWGPGGAGLAVILWRHRHLIRSQPFLRDSRRVDGFNIALLALIIVLLLSRLLPIRGMVAPAWGDSVHHTMIAQLIQDNGGLFRSWAPYAPIETFTYHFGYHAAMAVWATATAQPMPQAVITGSQLLNVLAALALYPLAVRLGGSRMAGFGAVLVAGLLSLQPGMYVNWGRYTQLAAQVILPVWLWTLDVWWSEPKRPRRRMLLVIVLLSTGLALTHYRVAVVALCAAVAWGAWSLWLMRKQWQEWLVRTLFLAGAGVLALGLAVPWILSVRSSRLTYVAGALAQRSTDLPAVRGELDVWRSIDTYYAPLLWAFALISAVVGLWRRRRLVIPMLIWVSLAFVAANPFLVGFPGTGIVTSFLLALGLYIPLSFLVGWLMALVWQELSNGSVRGKAVGKVGYAVLITLFAAYGIRQQATIVDPFYQMVTENDVAALNWIDKNIPAGGRFLANAFPAYSDSL